MLHSLTKTDNGNTKIKKTAKTLVNGQNVRVLSLSMLPDDEICPARWLAQCALDCLRDSGRGVMRNVIAGRQARTDLWHEDRDLFLSMLKKELRQHIKTSSKQGLLPVARLNVLSDIQWEKFIDFEGEFSELFAYDYTKLPGRLGKTPENYQLMFSYSKAEAYQSQVKRARKTGAPMTVVFRNGLPKTFLGLEVFDGDISDLDNLKQLGKVIGLRVKGNDAKKSDSPFIVNNPDLIAVA